MNTGARAMSITIRPVTLADADAVARIYNHGIVERQATFEIRPRSADEGGSGSTTGARSWWPSTTRRASRGASRG